MNARSLPTPHEIDLAQAAGKQFAQLSREGDQSIELRAEGGAQSLRITLPASAFSRLVEVLAQMANGNAVTIVPVHAEFTTQQAADFLNVSRPFLVALLEEGKLPFRLVGTHRRVLFADLQRFKAEDDRRREERMAELSADAQENNHGY